MNGESRNALKRARRKAQEKRRVEKGKRQAYVLIRRAELMLLGFTIKNAQQQARHEYDNLRMVSEEMWEGYNRALKAK